MEVLMNGKTIQYNMDFRKEYPDIFKILNDENHVIYYIENVEADDLVVFISPEQEMLTTIPFSEFEKFLRKLNKKVFFNISSLFSESFDIDNEENDIIDCLLVDRNTFLKPFKTNYRFQRINVITQNNKFLFYISPTNEMGKIYDIEIIKKKEQLLKKIGSICSKDTGKLFYHIPSKKLLIINFISGEIKFISPESIGFSKEDVLSLDKINYTWENVIFCDARRFFKIMSDKESPVKEINLDVYNNTLYICVVKNYQKFKTIGEVSKYIYNNPDIKLAEDIKAKLNTDDILYLSNGEHKDAIIYKSLSGYDYKYIEDLKLNKNCSEVISIFDKQDIIDIVNLNIPYILFVKEAKENKAPEYCLESEKHKIWSDFFSKTLYISRRDFN